MLCYVITMFEIFLLFFQQRGYEICNGNSPIDALCRDAKDPSILFNVETTGYSRDRLLVPCNTFGLICRNGDQQNSTCRDYEIRFECLSKKMFYNKLCHLN
jgi:hypothetical protein